MRILQLRFKNLNSLVGEWVIDFTAPEYISDGIFAISGPTGSGKSTILDAICLALYGRTPRLKNISKTTNEIMSRQTGVCFAEVVFETNSGRYRACWSQRRAREKADGLLQNPEHELSDVGTGKVLTSRIIDTKNEVEKQTGMDYDRFVQSMMLAQGGFAAFLQASGNERAPILEQITGTEIYSQISRHVFERKKEEKNVLDILRAENSSNILLSAEDEEYLKADLEEKKRKSVALTIERDRLDTGIRWIKTIDDLSLELQAISEEEKALTGQLQAFSPERQRLQFAQQAANIESDYVMLSGLRKHQHDDKQTLAGLKDLLPALNEKLIDAQATCDISEKRFAEARKANRLLLETCGKVRLIDQEIGQQKNAIKLISKEITRLSHEKEAESKKIRETDTAIGLWQDELKTIKVYFQANTPDAALVADFAGIRETTSNLIETLKQYKAFQDTVKQAEKEVIKMRQESLEMESYVQQAVKANAEDREAIAKTREEEVALLNGRPLGELQKQKDALILHLADLRKIADFDTERSRLEDGKACPLCGSLHHPYAEGNVPAVSIAEQELSELITLLKRLETLRAKVEELADKERISERAVDNCKSREENSQRQLQQATLRLTSLKEESGSRKSGLEGRVELLREALLPYGVADVPLNEPEMAALFQSLTRRRDQWVRHEVRQTELTAKISEAASVISSATAVVGVMQRDMDGHREKIRQADTVLAGLIDTRNALFGDKIVEDEEERMAALLQHVELEKERSLEMLRQHKQALTDNTNRINDLEKRTAERHLALSDAEESFLMLLAKAGFTDESDFCLKRMTVADRQHLEQHARTLDDMHTALRTRKADRIKRLATEKEKNLTALEMDVLKVQFDEVRKSLNSLLEETGAIHERLKRNEAARVRGEEIRKKISLQQAVFARWNRLNDLIGSADGKKYRNFAQGLTLEIMVSYANNQLLKLSDRYLLIRDRDEPLELNVMDNYQAGEVRSTKNLSGGESFIVSLALALGLSHMSSRNVRVDSLFLDEGFGTLDEDTLETALGTLAGLRQDGKMIGVISHVGAMKERINTKILVQPIREGRSVLNGPGVGRR